MNKIFNNSLIIVCLCFISFTAFAQNKSVIRGIVTAVEDGFTLPGANVLIQNKDGRVIAATATNLDGSYSLVSDGRSENILVVSFSGFTTQKIDIGNKKVIDVALKETVVELKGATVMAKKQVSNGMMNIAERELTTASKKIDMTDLKEIGSAGVDDALQGRVAGVDIVATSGSPGAGMAIRIRGTSSINGSSQPLIVVDGFPYEATISEDFDFSTANEEDYSQLLNIAPSDIKDIVVLKDAAATAIWGSKAANGVLQITTKRGGVSAPRIQYSFKGLISNLDKGIPTLSGDEYVTLMQEELMNSGRGFSPSVYPELANDANNPYYYYNYGQDTDWFDEVTRTGFAQEHNLSVSGGSSKAQYRASVGYYDQEGIVIGQEYSRINTRLNVDYNVSDKFKFTASMAYTYSDRDQNYVSYLNSNYDVLSQSYVRAPNMSVYEYNEAGVITGNYFTPSETLQGRWNGSVTSPYNPVAMAKDGFYKTVTHRIIPNLSVQWRPFRVIRYTLDVGFDVNNVKKNAFLPQTATGRPWTESTVNRSSDTDSEAFNMQIFNKLFWMPELGENNSLQVMIGSYTQDRKEKGYGVLVANTPSTSLIDPTNGGRLTNGIGSLSSSAQQYRKFSLYGMAQYGLFDRYIVNAVLRRDGSSKYGRAHRWGTYPSLSARYRLSGEEFISSRTQSWLEDFSLRFSWGKNGGEPNGNYPSIATYGVYGYEYLGNQGTSQSNLELVELRWEDTQQINYGFNFSAFQGRASLEFDYYIKNTKDLYLKNLKLPYSTGFSAMDYNAAKMKNKGFEVQGNVVPIKNKVWTLSVNFNFARNENILEEISDLYPQESGSWTKGGSYISMIKVGQPLGSFYGFKYSGVYLNEDQTIARDAAGRKIYNYNDKGEKEPVKMRFNYPSNGYEFQPGDAKYVDINNDGNIDGQDIVYLGNAMPLFTGGFGFNLKYKQLTLSTFFNFRYGNDIVNMAKLNMETMSGFDNQSKAVLRRWKHSYENENEAPSNLLPRAVYGLEYNYLASDRFVEDGSFLRFKQLTLRYNLSKDILKSYRISDASIYVTMQNLYCWTKYTGMDPEVTVSNPFSAGYDNAASPRAKEYWLGVNFSF